MLAPVLLRVLQGNMRLLADISKMRIECHCACVVLQPAAHTAQVAWFSNFSVAANKPKEGRLSTHVGPLSTNSFQAKIKTHFVFLCAAKRRILL